MSSSSSSSENPNHAEECRSERRIRLFGVELFLPRPEEAASSMRKSVSLGNLMHCNAVSGSALVQEADGYVSDGLVHSSTARARRKGVPWTEDEHRAFLVGLQKLGKGDWRGISRNYVKTRTPTQVASHAQKYFIRQSNLSKRKRRSSLFDISPELESKATPQKREVSTLQLSLAQEPFPITLAKICEEKAYVPEADAAEIELSPDLVSRFRTHVTASVQSGAVNSSPPTLSLGLGAELQEKQDEKSRIKSKVECDPPSGGDARLSLGLALEPSILTLQHSAAAFQVRGLIQCT